VFILNDYLSAHNAFGEWQRKWEGLKPLKYISLVGREGRTAIHLYYYNNEGIDFGMIDEIIGLINLTESKK